MGQVWKMVSVAALSIVKHTLGGVPLAATLQLNFMETFIATFVGGSVGVFLFMFLVDKISALFSRKKKKEKKKFTRTNRLVIKLKSKTGIWGIAMATPVLLSIPIGTIVATKFYGANRKTLSIMIVGVAVMSLIGSLLADEINQLIH